MVATEMLDYMRRPSGQGIVAQINKETAEAAGSPIYRCELDHRLTGLCIKPSLLGVTLHRLVCVLGNVHGRTRKLFYGVFQ